ncbi:putative phosphoglycerate mutase family protein [Aspergillus niger]|uniref:DUF3759 domain-containing protein n=1 Tax=Aspergillus lacticoffeatus (strain CBS 101883) TaxID=1450533 RepID=UPI000D7EECD5|nr:uncharacterized protein BO96DRAFT_136223 [Aspergillus niger CBS 101883]PYH52914.1 hypothetical protein BO96DRAFT_136223 [Aspergillus niger CBS 101883]GJP92886.1 putative phosphoglycerate mutase family protein [Aspergillus niger]
MAWFGESSEEAQAHDELYKFQEGQEVTEEHKAKFSHEFIGGAAAFAAMRAYEKHQAENGKPDNHAQAKEILAGLAGAFIDREVETKGLDFVDRERAKHHARKQLEEASAQDF